MAKEERPCSFNVHRSEEENRNEEAEANSIRSEGCCLPDPST
jgi:hypothetical protein